MGFFEKIGWFSKKEPEQANEKQLNTDFASSVSTGWFEDSLSLSYVDPVAALLSDCNDKINEEKNARSWVGLSRLLYDKVAVYENGLNKRVDMIGTPVLANEADLQDATVRAAKDWLSNVSVLGEWNDFSSDTKGAAALVREMGIRHFKDGICFAQDRFGNDGLEYRGIMLFDSDNFSLHVKDKNTTFAYLTNQFPRWSEEEGYFQNPFFHVLKHEMDRRSPWGIPLLRGGHLDAELLVTLLITIKQQTQRFANPASITLIQPEDIESILVDGRTDMTKAEALKQSVQRVKRGYETAIRQMKKGKGAEYVSSIPASKVKILSKTFGEGFSSWINPETLWQITTMFSMVTGVPASLLLEDGGGGMGSEKFNILFKMLLGKTEKTREAILPIISGMLKNYLLHEGFSPREVDVLNLQFNSLDFQTEEEKSAIRKQTAETERIQYETFEMIRGFGNDEAAAAYAESVGLSV